MNTDKRLNAVIVVLVVLICSALLRIVFVHESPVTIVLDERAVSDISVAADLSGIESVDIDSSWVEGAAELSDFEEEDVVTSDYSVKENTTAFNDSDSGTAIMADSDVVLVGDSIPIWLYDGSLVCSIADDLKYFCQPELASFHIDELGYRNYLKAESAGKILLTGTKSSISAEKEFYLLDPNDAESMVDCDMDNLVFTVDANGCGSGALELKVEGKNADELDTRAYTTGDARVTISAKWEENILKMSVINYLSPGNDGELVVVFTEKDNPQKLIGFNRIGLKIT